MIIIMRDVGLPGCLEVVAFEGFDLGVAFPLALLLAFEDAGTMSSVPCSSRSLGSGNGLVFSGFFLGFGLGLGLAGWFSASLSASSAASCFVDFVFFADFCFGVRAEGFETPAINLYAYTN